MADFSSNQVPIYANTGLSGVGVLNAATAGTMGSDTNGVAIVTAGASGSRISTLSLNTDDTAAVNVFIYILSGATVIPLGMVYVPAGSGNTATGTTPNVDAFSSTGLQGMLIDANGKKYIPLNNNEVLKCAVLANMTALKKCYVTAIGASY